MKNLVFIVLIVTALQLQAQRRGYGGGRHAHAGRVVHAHRSPYRPAKIVVYHPAWRPYYGYNRRWVYFPKYNLYWDNWRNHYLFWSAGAWISRPIPPPVVVNVNLANEKHRELKETEDDVDDVYRSNKEHQESEK